MFGGISGTIDVSWLVINDVAGAQTGGNAEATFFVSTDGNDGWSGTLAEPNAEKNDGPFATIARARDAIREMKGNGGLAGPVNVMMRGGTHFLDETVVFGTEDSGTEDCPITYMAYPGEEPIISGGRRITGPWKSYKGEIVVCSIDEVREGKLLFRQLFVNGERQTRARFRAALR